MSTTHELTCVFCKEVFEEKEALQIHFRKHADPNFNQTKVKNSPQNDEQKASEKTNEETDMVQCDACSEVFPTISKAITHKHKVHPDLDAKYFCPYCGKLFTLKHLYNKHLSSHESNIEENYTKDFHCDSCEVDFYVAAAMLHHNKFFHRQDTMLPDIGHSRKQKLFNQELLPIYYCTFCGEEYNNKVNLHKHMHDDHSDENQSPDEVLRCPLCNAIFYHLDAYELHLTYHSSEDLYSEKNEMHENLLTEYSLETVPPLMERVENMGEENNSVDLEKFLQIAMDSDNTNNEQYPERKKKHKKHKKSKKTITLDEFLNMNKDFFGEGIDFQGIEEVPSQVVAKQLKTKRIPQKDALKAGSQAMSSSDLEKLKKQGIIVKTKSGKSITPMQGIKLGSKVQSHANKIIQLDKKGPESHTKVISTSSSEVLSKLINQSNNQISIVKKPAQEVSDVCKEEIKTSTGENAVPLNTETISKNDLAMEEDEGIEKIETYKEISEEGLLKNKLPDNNLEKDYDDNYESSSKDLVDQNKSISKKSDVNEKPICTITEYSNNECVKNLDQSDLSNTVNHLKTVNQQITIKSVKQSSNNPLHEKDSSEETEDQAVDVAYPNSMSSREAETGDHIEKSHSEDSEEEKLVLPNKFVKKPLDALKHLGNITIKSVNQFNNKITDENVNNMANCEPNHDENDSKKEENYSNMETQIMPDVSNLNQLVSIQPDKNSHKPVNALKNLSNITVKPLIQSPMVDTEEFTDDENYEETFSDSNSEISTNQASLKVVSHKNITIPGQNVSFKCSTQNLNPNIQPMAQSSPIYKTTSQNNDDSGVIDESLKKPQHATDILKHLKNVTAKPLKVVKNNSSQVTFKSATQSVNKQFMQQSTKKHEVTEEVEIFNVDDSDSDKEENLCKDIVPCNLSNNIDNKLTNVESLKACNKKMILKSANQEMNKNIEQQFVSTFKTRNDKTVYTQGDSFVNPNENGLVKPTTETDNNNALKNALKNLGKNITIKSRNASPNYLVKTPNKRDFIENDNTDDIESDSDSLPGHVKITEITEDNMSDDEFPEKLVKNQGNSDCNVSRSINQSPRHSFSDYEDDDNYELMDVEEKIKINSLNKSNQSTFPVNQKSSYKEGFKNIGKDITIKSSNVKKTCNENEFSDDNEPQKDVPEFPESLNKELTIKPFRQTNTARQDLSKTSNNQGNLDQALNQKGNEVNTVNKEVTVKTYKTETVIEEITTTVTKTIRTVNQTTKQEIQNKNPSFSSPPVRMQKIGQNIRCNQQVKKSPGVPVRHISPMALPRMRHPINPVRPTVSAVRPSSQLVPVRAGVNIARPSNPRMPTVNKINPAQSSQAKPVIGKPLKISPNVMNATNKRPILNQQPGPFKKPKEMFMTESDAMNSSGKSTVNFASTSQMTSCNFTSTKTVKGNCVVASTQMKSEMSSSQQCFSKLNNVTGLKIVKSSQAKQISKVEEKYDGASKRTLDAIEMLQKQGLLVKKPRLNVNDDSEHSNSEDEETANYTVEEFED